MTLHEIEAEIHKVATTLAAQAWLLPTFGFSDGSGRPHIEVDALGMHWVNSERGQEYERRTTRDLVELLYWVFSTVTFSLAMDYEVAHRVEGQDTRRLLFARQIELLRDRSPRWGELGQEEHDRILSIFPFDDQSSLRVKLSQAWRKQRHSPDVAWELACEHYPLPRSAIKERVRPIWERSLPAETSGLSNWVFEWLIGQYTQPRRVYHTLEHIERMFAVWDEVAYDVPVADRIGLSLAIWFHDAVYEPMRNDNEDRSAKEAERRLPSLGVKAQSVVRAQYMIRATQSHKANTIDVDTTLLLDLDLSIFGAEPTAYDAYARAIRQEFRHVNEADYCDGRIGVLTTFLDRPRIFMTSSIFERFEESARSNIVREIDSLRART